MVNKCEYKLVFETEEAAIKDIISAIDDTAKTVLKSYKITGSKLDVKISNARKI